MQFHKSQGVTPNVISPSLPSVACMPAESEASNGSIWNLPVALEPVLWRQRQGKAGRTLQPDRSDGFVNRFLPELLGPDASKCTVHTPGL